jgi:hypothetical protein
LILLARGRVERRALEHALEAQRAAGHGRIGDWLQQLSSVSERDVTAALSQQWGCPMFSLAKPPDPGAMALVPLPLLEEFDMVPVRYDVRRGTLFLAFGGTVAHAAMLAIESMLDCRVHPCVAESSRVRALHEQLRQRAVPGTYVFPTASDAAEMARVALSYGRRLEARAVRTAKLRSLVWIRLERAAKFTDLLFRFPEVPGRGMARSGPRPLKLESAGADNREGYGNHHAKSADSHRG